MKMLCVSLFETIADHYQLSVTRNAEFPGVHRAPITIEGIIGIMNTLKPWGNNSHVEVYKRACGDGEFNERVLVCGEPNSFIPSHIHENTPTFVVGIAGVAGVEIGDQKLSLPPFTVIDFPRGEVHSLKMGDAGCMFLAFSQAPVVSGDKAVDIKLV